MSKINPRLVSYRQRSCFCSSLNTFFLSFNIFSSSLIWLSSMLITSIRPRSSCNLVSTYPLPVSICWISISTVLGGLSASDIELSTDPYVSNNWKSLDDEFRVLNAGKWSLLMIVLVIWCLCAPSADFNEEPKVVHRVHLQTDNLNSISLPFISTWPQSSPPSFVGLQY